MSKVAYIKKKFGASSASIISMAEEICVEYARQGYDLTLRQLYYQFVARGIIPNKDTEYDRLGSIINDARLAGLIDWSSITDRTRNLQARDHFSDPADIINAIAPSYFLDLWNNQENYVEVWVEKEALAGVVAQVANRWDVPYFSCRGYVSQSEMRAAGIRLADKLDDHNQAIIIHLGDHDPSGIDMSRDIEERLSLFMTSGTHYPADEDDIHEIKNQQEDLRTYNLVVDRIALNMDQIRTYNPPPNPAKLTDSRCADYIGRFGDQSWELDALSPLQMDELISDAIQGYLDIDTWNKDLARQTAERQELVELSTRWADVSAFLKEG